MATHEKWRNLREFSYYMERLEFFFTANGIEDVPENVGKRKPIQLNIIGNKSYGHVKDLLAPNRSTSKSYSEIDEILKYHFVLKPSEVIQWYKFYARARKTHEPVANFVTELKRVDCSFAKTQETMIRDRIVWNK